MSSERVSGVDQQNPRFCCLKTLIPESLAILRRNKLLFLSVFLLLALPLSLLSFSLSLASAPLKSQVRRLESLAALAHTRFEARHVFHESRSDALSLFRLKLLFFLPSSLLSLLAALSSVSAAHSAYHRRHPSALYSAWMPPLVTSICVYVSLSLCGALLRALVVAAGSANPGLGFLVRVVGLGAEVYLGSVMAMGLVVSILERRFGWDAIRVGSGLMAGRRFCGWALSGFLAAATGWIGAKMEAVAAEGGELVGESKWAVMTAAGRREAAALVVLYAAVVVWGYVVVTVFYCECRKRHVVKEEEEDDRGVDLMVVS